MNSLTMSERPVYIPGVDIDRRKGPGSMVKVINTLAVLSWLFLFFSLLVLDQAQPKLLTPGAQWNHNLLGILYYLLLIVFGMSLTGLMLNRRRNRRKDDAYRLSLVISMVVSFFGLLRYLANLFF